MFAFLKTPIGILSILVVLGGGAGVYASISEEKEPEYEFVLAEAKHLVQEVSVTGRVEAVSRADLAFERGGKVSKTHVFVGDVVKVGNILVELESGEISAQLLQARANLEVEQARLSEFERGSRPEEINAAETKVENAKRVLSDAKKNLQNVKHKAEADLAQVYSGTLTALQAAASVGKDAFVTLSDIQFAHSFSSREDFILKDKKSAAIKAMLGEDNAGSWATDFISRLDGGAFGLVQDAARNPTQANIDTSLSEMLLALQYVQAALNAVPVTSDLTASEKSDLTAEKSLINTEVTTLTSKEQLILTQKATNENAVSSGEASVTTAQNSLANSEDELALKRAGTVAEQISAQEARVKSAEANIENLEAQLGKTVLKAPITGVVARQNAKAGEIVGANMVIVSLISDAEYEIEAYIPEADIAKVSVGNTAEVTLDAYGRDEDFIAKVVSIDPAETILEGVATYKVVLHFSEKDTRVRPGMTANIDIVTATRESVIAIPQRAIMREDGEKIVRVLLRGSVVKIPVDTGLRGSDGNIEIVRGLSAGDRVVTFIEE